MPDDAGRPETASGPFQPDFRGGCVLLPADNAASLGLAQRVRLRNSLAMELLWTRQAVESRLQVKPSG